MALSDFFLNDFETSAKAEDSRLLPHIYQNDYYAVQNTISDKLKQVGMQLLNVDNTYHEMLFEYKKATIVFTLSELGMYEIEVNIKINTHYLLPFKRPIKMISQIYEILDHSLYLKNKGGLYE